MALDDDANLLDRKSGPRELIQANLRKGECNLCAQTKESQLVEYECIVSQSSSELKTVSSVLRNWKGNELQDSIQRKNRCSR